MENDAEIYTFTVYCFFGFDKQIGFENREKGNSRG